MGSAGGGSRGGSGAPGDSVVGSAGGDSGSSVGSGADGGSSVGSGGGSVGCGGGSVGSGGGSLVGSGGATVGRGWVGVGGTCVGSGGGSVGSGGGSVGGGCVGLGFFLSDSDGFGGWVGGTWVGVRVGKTTEPVGVCTADVGVALGLDDWVAVASTGCTSPGTRLGEGVAVGGATTVLGAQNSVTSRSPPGFRTISRHVGSVTVSDSSSQAAAPSSTARCVASSLTSILISEGTLKSVTDPAAMTNSYDGFCAKNRMFPCSTIICKRGRVGGFCTSIWASGESSSVLPSPKKNLAPSTGSAAIRPLPSMAKLALPSIGIHSDPSTHCTCAFPE